MRLPRPLHPGAWWLWALGLATAASRTTQPLSLALVIAVTAYVVAARRTDAPWARTYDRRSSWSAHRRDPDRCSRCCSRRTPAPTVLFTLPSLPMPDWAAG